jgi:hypothetical protein
MPIMAPAGFDMAIWGEYFRRGEYYRRHLARYRRYVEAHGLVCQECDREIFERDGEVKLFGKTDEAA